MMVSATLLQHPLDVAFYAAESNTFTLTVAD